MKKGTHGADEISFDALDYAGQARTLNAQILGIEKGLKAHIRRGVQENKLIDQMKGEYITQLERLIKGLK